jgi:hypothetical protein
MNANINIKNQTINILLQLIAAITNGN